MKPIELSNPHKRVRGKAIARGPLGAAADGKPRSASAAAV